MLKKILLIACLVSLLGFVGASRTGAAAPEAPSFSTYVGGSGYDEGLFVEIDPLFGFIYAAGDTNSLDFPVIAGLPPFLDPDFHGDGFVTGFGPRGSVIVSTYIGTHNSDVVKGTALFGGALFAGGIDTNYEGSAPFVAAVAPFGYVDNRVLQLAVQADLQGMAAGPRGLWVCGRWSDYDEGYGVGNYLALVDPWTLGLLDTVYFDDFDEPDLYLEFGEVAVDPAGYLYVAGKTPGRQGPPWQSDLFIRKLSPDGRHVLYTVVVRGRGEESVSRMVVDAAGRVWVSGTTTSADWPLTAPVQPGFGGGSDAFVVTLDPSGRILLSTYVGGPGAELAGGITSDGAGGLYLTGTAGKDAFLARLGPPGSGAVTLVPVGGSGSDEGADVALAPGGGVVVVGGTNSTDLPVVNAFQPVPKPWDAFVLSLPALTLNLPPVCSGAAASPSVVWPPNGKMVPVSILGVTDPEGEAVSLTITGITHDESGAGASSSGIGSSTARVKAERDGKGDGRVYHITFEAADPLGASCTGEVTVCVPHDQGGKSCGDGLAQERSQS